MELHYDLVHISLVDGCNLKCRWCLVPEEFTYVTMEQFRSTIENLNRNVASSRHTRLIGSGEGLLHPRFAEALSLFQEYKVPTVSKEIWTNGTKVRPTDMERLFELNTFDYLVFSFDGYGDKATYEYIRRGASFDKVVANIRMAAAVRDRKQSRTRIVVSAIVPHAGAMPFEPVPEAEVHRRFEQDLFPFVDQVMYRGVGTWNGVVEVNGLAPKPPGTIGPCRVAMKPELVIDARGFVHPCCNDISLQVSLGNVHDREIADIARSMDHHFERLARGEPVHGCATCNGCHYSEPNAEYGHLLREGNALFRHVAQMEIHLREQRAAIEQLMAGRAGRAAPTPAGPAAAPAGGAPDAAGDTRPAAGRWRRLLGEGRRQGSRLQSSRARVRFGL